MFDPRINAYLRRVRGLLSRPGPETGDAALLERLARDRDSAAFTELLTRHGPRVWALCRRLACSEADAEDVFQATFLVLLRNVTHVRKAASIGSWLFGVAFRMSRKARAKAERFPDLNRLRTPAAPADPVHETSWNEVRRALDEELALLPDMLRAPVLLCYFDGLTQDEAANELGWNPRTVKARVARARELLRSRLSRRGIELPAVLAVPLLSASLASGIPKPLMMGLNLAALNLVRGQPTGPEISPSAIALSQTEGSAVSLVRLTVLLVSALGLLTAGSLVGRPTTPINSNATPATDSANVDAPAPAVDDKPTPGAVRIGTTRFRPAMGWHKKVFFTTDGKTLIAPLEGKAVELWDAESGRRLHEIPIPQSSFQDCDFDSRSNLLVLFGTKWPDDLAQKTELVIWFVDTAARKVVRTVRIPEIEYSVHYSLSFTPDGKRFITAVDGELRVWDTKSGEELIRQKHRGGVDAVAVSRDGKTIAFGRYDVFVWKWESGEEPKKLATINGFGTELVGFSGDNKTLFVAISGGRFLTFEVATGRQTGSFDLDGSPWKWSLSPDGNTLAITFHSTSRANAVEHSVLLWDTIAGKERTKFSVGNVTATNPRWSPDGTRLAASTDHRLWVWDVKTGKPFGPTLPGHEGLINAFAFGPDGQLFTASDDHTVRSWNPTTGQPGLELIHEHWVRGVAVSPDGSLVAGSALNNDLRIWDAKTGVVRFQLLGNGVMGGTRKVQFTRDGKRLIAWGDDLYLRVWDMRNGKLLAEHRTLPEGLTETQLENESSMPLMRVSTRAFDISADGSTFAFCRYEILQVFDVETGKERARFEVEPNGASSLALSPDGKRVAIGGNGKPIETRLPDGRTRHSIAKDHQFAVWDIATKKVVWQTKTIGVWSTGIAFTPDSKLVGEIAGSDQHSSLNVWNSTTGKSLGQIPLLGASGYFTFDRTGKHIAVSHHDTTATVYDLEMALKLKAQK